MARDIGILGRFGPRTPEGAKAVFRKGGAELLLLGDSEWGYIDPEGDYVWPPNTKTP